MLTALVLGSRRATRQSQSTQDLDPQASKQASKRRGWDSNPRKVALHTLSKRADSAALAPLPYMSGPKSERAVRNMLADAMLLAPSETARWCLVR